MQPKYLLLYVCLTVLYRFSLGDNITITIPNGQITEITQVTKSNYSYYAFKSIRYAQPPVGNLRFKAPVPADPWNGTYDATYEKKNCMQPVAAEFSIDEDCLYLHVYTPKISNVTLPVMFIIHGGGFQIGSGALGPDFFMEYDVVVVTINYRLGAFGFMSTNDTVIPGNAGLKDQNLALKWTQQNIKYFGGDPNKVTILGGSAGSASVSYQLLSPKSAGLFRAAVQESGSAISPWAYQRDPAYFSFKLASYIDPNFTSNSSQNLLEFLLKASATDILDAAIQISTLPKPGDKEIQNGFAFAPVIEADHNDAFITEKMYESFASGNFNKVPIIIGMTAEDGMLEYNNATFKEVVDAFDSNGSLLVPHNMHINASDPNIDTVIKTIENFYGISQDQTYENQIAGTIRYFTDHSFDRSITKQAELQSKYSDVYFYVFAYKGEMGNNPLYIAGTGNVTHGEENYYMFPQPLQDGRSTDDLDKFPESDRQTHYRFVKLWVNFVTTLNPTPETEELLQNVTWPKVNLSNGIQYLDINKDLSIETNPRSDAYRMWNDLYKNYAIQPYDGF